MKEKIEFTEFLEISGKLEIQVGCVLTAERIPKSTKLLKLTVSFKLDGSDVRTVVTNLGSQFEPEKFVGMICPFITNLKPSVMMNVTSEAMILVGINDNTLYEFNNYTVGTKLL